MGPFSTSFSRALNFCHASPEYILNVLDFYDVFGIEFADASKISTNFVSKIGLPRKID